jgi:hypothetical protein
MKLVLKASLERKAAPKFIIRYRNYYLRKNPHSYNNAWGSRVQATQFETLEEAQGVVDKLSGDFARAKVVRYNGPHEPYVPPAPPPPKDMDLPLEDFLKKYQGHEMYSDFIVKRYGQEVFEQLKTEGKIEKGGGWNEGSNASDDTWIVK